MFSDRTEAGKRLAGRLVDHRGSANTVVLGLPRGGVVPAFEVAKDLHLPLDVIIVRKIGFPGSPEFAIGAVSESGMVMMNSSIVSAYRIDDEYIEKEIELKKDEIARRAALYRNGKGMRDIRNKTVILVDDGVATGASMKASIKAVRKAGPARIIVALPVAPPSTMREIEEMAEEVICLEVHEDFGAVGNYYEDFSQVSDEQVVELLQRARDGLS